MKIQERSYSSEILLLDKQVFELPHNVCVNADTELVEKLTKKDKPKEIISFKSGEDFLKEWERINGN